MAENKTQKLFKSELVVINVGLKLFAEALDAQGVKTLQVDWKPATEKDKEIDDILNLLGGI